MIRSPAEASAPSASRTVRVGSTLPRWIRSSRMRWESSRQRAQSEAISRTLRPVRELDVAEPVGEEHHGAAALDGGELLLVSGEDQLAAVAGRVPGNRGQVGD